MGEPDEHSLIDRIRSWARHHALEHTAPPEDPLHGPTLPTTQPSVSRKSKHAQRSSSGSTATTDRHLSHVHNSIPDTSNRNNASDSTSSAPPPPAPPPNKSEAEGTSNSAIETKGKPKITTRLKNSGTRFYLHTKDALTYSWLNLLLVFVPVGIIVNELHVNPSVIFAINAVAIIPLAGLLSHATESVASKLGDTLGALLNVSFGNAVELIIFIALVKNEIRIVQASLLGSILSNLLLILGMAFLLGGLRFREQIYNSTVTQMSACLLSLSVTSLLLPTAFHASFADSADADDKVLKVSRGTSVVLLVVYILYLLFQLKSHAYMYESTPQQVIDEESYPGILADVFDSSSSSDGSGSSSSSDTDTSGSHTTTKRIKRAFRNRRRRKSSVSSTNTPSIPSTVSSPSQERPGHVWESQTTPPLRIPVPRRGSVLGMITSGDEADTDGEFDRDGTEPRIRDFGGKTDNASTAAPKERRQKNKPKKKHHRHHKRHSHADKFGKSEDPDEGSSIRGPGKEVLKEPSQSKVGFSDEVQVGAAAEQSQKRGLGGILSSQTFRPALPKMLSNNVFVTPPPPSSSPALGGPPMMPRKIDGLRRTNSLPDRLNRQGTPANAQRSAVPPYPRGIAEAEDIPDEEDEEENKPPMSKTAATVLLLISTALVAVCAEFLVDAIPAMIDSTPVSQAFIGLIILPIVSNAAEHVTAVTVAAKNKMDLAIGVSVGSSIQIALFVTPLVVLLGWILDRDMSLYFNLFETISLFVTAFVVNFLVLDGRSNYLEGSLLIAAYVIIAVAAFFYPDGTDASSLGGASD